MEDQQPEPGGVSDDESTAPAAETEDQSEAQSEGETEGQAEPTDTDSADSEPTDAEPTEPDRPAGRRRARVSAAALGLAVAAVIGAGAWAGAAVQPYLADRAAVTTRLQVARAATTAITTLWTYTPEDIGTLPDRVADYLTGDLAAQYRKDIEAIAVRYRQAEISLDSEVVGWRSTPSTVTTPAPWSTPTPPGRARRPRTSPGCSTAPMW